MCGRRRVPATMNGGPAACPGLFSGLFSGLI
jgi:hypothetical protein